MVQSPDTWTKVGVPAQVVGSVATFLAVVVALKLAREERAIKLRVSAKFMSIISEHLDVKVMAVTVENTGHRKATVEGFYWSTGYFSRISPRFLRAQTAMQMEDYSWAINQRFPWVLEPGDSKSTFIRKTDFLDSFKEAQDGDLFRKMPFTNRWRLFNHRVGIGVRTLPTVYLGTVDPKLTQKLEANYSKNREQ
jgi:hypothetical protein